MRPADTLQHCSCNKQCFGVGTVVKDGQVVGDIEHMEKITMPEKEKKPRKTYPVCTDAAPVVQVRAEPDSRVCHCCVTCTYWHKLSRKLVYIQDWPPP